MAAVWDYLVAIWHNWVAVMTGGPLLVDKLAKWFYPGYENWISKVLPPPKRTTFVYFISLIGLLVANFLAFNEQRTLLIAASKITQEVMSEASFVTATGSDQNTALPVTARYTVILPSPEKSGVILQPTGQRPLTLRNAGLRTLFVYPPVGGEINDSGVNQPVTVPYEATFVCNGSVKCSA